ncbi:excisionase family DNA-binding protein [Rubripirellula reticaptiva]|uniref:Helix-turn-helix domain protein n=1 Tax=Rubripirellula reticaptiva TaxID=2528013 RepID=A0A5C6EV14_9BACT|nr:excisionase family DNA-binding protein [Rubripirellula reticaptiva]TWU51141.1 Helix-turn-helix domain protein [Rubripirellula reticaptiva]
MADLLIRDTNRDELIRDTAEAVAKLLRSENASEAMPMLVDGDEMARLAGISRPTIDRAVRSGLIPSIMVGRARRFRPAAVITALESASRE